MQLNTTTDYAIRILLYLYEMQEAVPSAEVAEKMGIPANYVLSISRKLSKAGMVKGQKGNHGGLEAVKKPEEVSIWDIWNVMERTVQCSRCLESDAYCSRSAADTCPIRKPYCVMQKELEDKLSAVTMKTLLEL